MSEVLDGSEKLDYFFPSDPRYTYFIPRFQRGYSWRKEHVKDFLDDLRDRNNDGDTHYFGMFFLNHIKEGKKEIIDGQQRITTVILYFVVCRDFLKDKLSKTTDPVEKEVKKMLEKLEKKLTPYNGSNILKVGKVNEGLFERLYSYESPDSKIDKEKQMESDSDEYLLDAYKQILNEIKNFNHTKIESYIDTLLTQFCAAKLNVNSMAQAFKIFETINDRGEPLDQTDLIKNYIFSNLEHQNNLSNPDLDRFNDRWSDMSQRITGQNSANYVFDDFVRHVLLVEYKITEKKDELYQGLKKVLDDPTNTPQKVIGKLETWSRVFEKLHRPELESKWKNHTITAFLILLKSIRAINVYSALMSGFDYYKTSPKDFGELTKFLFTYQVRVKQVMGDSESKISATTKNIVQKITEAKKNNEKISLKKILDPIKEDERKNDEVFKEIAKQFKSNKRQIVKYILQNVKGEKNYEAEVEHIMPTSSSEWVEDIIKWNKFDKMDPKHREAKVKSYHTMFKDSIGNQMLLEPALNRLISNKNFKTKKELGYSQSGFSEAQAISKYKKWTSDDIEKRQAKLTTTIIDLFTIK